MGTGDVTMGRGDVTMGRGDLERDCGDLARGCGAFTSGTGEIVMPDTAEAWHVAAAAASTNRDSSMLCGGVADMLQQLTEDKVCLKKQNKAVNFSVKLHLASALNSAYFRVFRACENKN